MHAPSKTGFRLACLGVFRCRTPSAFQRLLCLGRVRLQGAGRAMRIHKQQPGSSLIALCWNLAMSSSCHGENSESGGLDISCVHRVSSSSSPSWSSSSVHGSNSSPGRPLLSLTLARCMMGGAASSSKKVHEASEDASGQGRPWCPRVDRRRSRRRTRTTTAR